MSESTQNLAVFLVQAIVISLSGVMAPGAMTAATLAAGTKNRHAGALLAVGHGFVEFPLMFAIMAGMGAILIAEPFKIGVGLIGGAILLLLAFQMLRSAGDGDATQQTSLKRGPILTGVLLTAGNPYFLLWWATIGLRLSMEAVELGPVAFALFAVIHWTCDLVWLELLTLAVHRGATLLGGKLERIVLGLCGAALAVIGVRFIYLACIGMWA